MLSKRTTRSSGGELRRIYEAAENYSTSALDIIIENGVFSSVSLKVLERVVCREILERKGSNQFQG